MSQTQCEHFFLFWRMTYYAIKKLSKFYIQTLKEGGIIGFAIMRRRRVQASQGILQEKERERLLWEKG